MVLYSKSYAGVIPLQQQPRLHNKRDKSSAKGAAAPYG